MSKSITSSIGLDFTYSLDLLWEDFAYKLDMTLSMNWIWYGKTLPTYNLDMLWEGEEPLGDILRQVEGRLASWQEKEMSRTFCQFFFCLEYVGSMGEDN